MSLIYANFDVGAPASSLAAEMESALGAHVMKAWERNRRARDKITNVLFQCLRQRKSEYDPDVLADIKSIGGSEIYPPITAIKVREGISWISDILLPSNGEPAWGLEPTPVQDLPPEIMQQILDFVGREAAIAEQVGQPMDQRTLQYRMGRAIKRTKDMLQKRAKFAAEQEAKVIEDQLAEGEWEEALAEFISDFMTFPTAILKGPVMRSRKTLQWDMEGRPTVGLSLVECNERVSPFDTYPAPYARSPQDGDFIEIMHLYPADLEEMRGVPCYYDDAIDKVMLEYGRSGLHNWLLDRDSERREGENKETQPQGDSTIDAIHYWGAVPGYLLLERGMSPDLIQEPMTVYQVEVIKVGRHVIKCAMNSDPLGHRPYYHASYHDVPGAFWGESPPMMMRDIQKICGGTGRALSNNMGFASGPMIGILRSRLQNQSTTLSLGPFEIFEFTSDVTGNDGPPLQFYQPDSRAAELLKVMDYFMVLADQATSIPRYDLKDNRLPGAHQTAQGMAMLLEAMTKGLRQAVRNIDSGVIRPRIERAHRDNMLYNMDLSVKADLQVVARGASALVAKASTQSKRNEYLRAITNPLDAQILGPEVRLQLHREMIKDLDMPDLIPDEETMQMRQRQAQAEAQKGQGADPRMQQAQAAQQRNQVAAQANQARMQMQAQLEQAKLQDKERDRQLKMAMAQMGRQANLEQSKTRLAEKVMDIRSKQRLLADESRLKREMGSGI